jgi:hypothetical protein
MSRISRLVAIAVLSLLGAVAAASADPVTITSGTLVAVRPADTSGPASLRGTRGFSLEATVSTVDGRVNVLTNCEPCLPGSPLSVAGILSGFVFEGVAMLDGKTFTDLSGVPTDSASIYMEFFGETVLPVFQNADLLVTLPFRLEGMFTAPSTSAALRGHGLATVLLQPQVNFDEPPSWIGRRVVYDFGNQATVPEPSTMILVGGGLIAIARRVRRRV